jgi:hypothetical protein
LAACRQLQISCSFAHLRFQRTPWFPNRLFDRDLDHSGATATTERFMDAFDRLVHRNLDISVPSTGLIAPTTRPAFAKMSASCLAHASSPISPSRLVLYKSAISARE